LKSTGIFCFQTDADPEQIALNLPGVARLFPEQNCGSILGTDGNEIYFHRNSVANGGFDKLAVGDEVRFVAQHSESAKGPQASTVVPLGKHHLPRAAAVRG